MNFLHRAMKPLAYVLNQVGLDRWSWNLRFAYGKGYGADCPQLADLISGLARGGKLVEHGCGRGTLPGQLKRSSFSAYIGYDISDMAVELARKNHPEWHFERMSAEEWPGEDAPVDVVIAREFVNYLQPDVLRRFITVSLRCLIPEGRMIITLHDRHKHARAVAVCREFTVDQEILGSNGIVLVLANDQKRASVRRD